MANLNPRWIVGKTIAKVELNAWKDDAGHTRHKPRIIFTDGTRITFHTQEVEGGGDYGTGISYWKGHPNER